MDITITITNPTPELLALLAGEPGPKTKPAPKGKTTVETVAAQSPASDAVEASPPAAEKPSEDIALTVKTRAQQVAAKNGRETVADFIKKSGGTTGISTIPDDKREHFIALCDEALGE